MSQNQDTSDILIYNKGEFKKTIVERISKGNEILNTKVSPINANLNMQTTHVCYKKEDLDLFKDNYRKWNAYNENYLSSAFNLPNNKYCNEYKNAVYLGNLWQTKDEINECKKTIQKKINVLENIMVSLDIIPCSPQTLTEYEDIRKNKNIFIVHGHDTSLKLKVKDTLTKLGLNPIILQNQANKGATIIEKFETNAQNAGYAIVLLTADDEGKAKEDKEYAPRARQNVILEMGYFIGKIGRERVSVIYDETVEKPGDIAGIAYIRYDDVGGWKSQLVKELEESGYNIDINHL